MQECQILELEVLDGAGVFLSKIKSCGTFPFVFLNERESQKHYYEKI
tara:strand:- start:91566 stop:91706 length:141 start_codon:yes stop_codon:yes gene_type:complete